MPTQTPAPAFKKTSLMRQVERANAGRPVNEVLIEALNDAGTVQGAAEKLGVTSDTLRKLWMPKMGIRLQPHVVPSKGTTK